MKCTSPLIGNGTLSRTYLEALECELVPKGRIPIPKCKALPLGQIHVPRFLQNRTLCVGSARRAAACGGVWRRPLLKLTRFSVVDILHTEGLLLQERPRRHQGEGGRQRRLLCRRGIALVAACGSGAAYGGVVWRRQPPAAASS